MDASRKLLWSVMGLLLALLSAPAGAQDRSGVWWERKAPSVEEVSGGKLKVGDKITKENVDVVKDYMPEAFYLDTKNGAVWEILPTTPGEKLVPRPLVEATKANLGKAVIDGNGTVRMADGSPWIGGFPVPEPKSGLDVMVNRQFKTTDGHLDKARCDWINSAGETYKKNYLGVRAINMTARTCQDPKPVIPGHEDEISRELLLFTDPYDVKGLSVLTVVYVDQSKLPDAWGYIPVLRRVQRFSTGQRYDSADGSDLRAGDLDTFSDPLGLWDFKLVDRKFMFSVVTGAEEQSGAFPVETQNANMLNGRYPADAKVELRDTYIVEATPKDPTHIYSRKLLFVDAATWWSWMGQFYDKQGNLWYQFSLWFRRLDSDCGNFPSLTWVPIQNYQTGSATICPIEWYLRYPEPARLNPEMFTLKYIMAQGR